MDRPVVSVSAANALRLPGKRQPHVESYFIKLNSPSADRSLWLKHTILCRGDSNNALAEVWGVVFVRGSAPRAFKHTRVFDRETAAGLTLEPNLALAELPQAATQVLRGAVPSASRPAPLTWQLTCEPGSADGLLAPLPGVLYAACLPNSKLCSPHPDLRFSGQYKLGAETQVLAGWYGMQGHNWGKRHTPAYCWMHCNQLQQAIARGNDGGAAALPGTLIEAVSAGVGDNWESQLRTGAVVLRHAGESYRFGPRDWRPSAERRHVGRWEFQAEARGQRLSVQVLAEPRELAGLCYENPKGLPLYCLNSKLAELRLKLERPGLPALELCSSAAALEQGTRRADHGVPILV